MLSIIPGDSHYFVLCALVTIAMQLAGFAIAYLAQFDKVTDFAGSTNFILLALLTLFANGSYAPRHILMTSCLCLCRAELAIFLLSRVLKRGKDERFDSMRANFGAFLGFWIFQMVWAWVVSLPVIFVQGDSANPALEGRDWAGLALFVFGFGLEVVADLQKDAFRSDDKNKGKVCATGVWSWSRHPNFAGEILLWFGIWIMATPVADAGSTWGYFTIISPILTFVLLMFASGMPTAEGDNQKRYMRSPAARDAFIAYRNRTSVLLPLPPPLYAALPLIVKRIFLFEFPMYETDWTYCGEQPTAVQAQPLAVAAGSYQAPAAKEWKGAVPQPA